jgi:ethanolamine utilization protein EutN
VKIGVVIGVAWASKKVEELDGCRMYVIQPVSSEGKPTETPVVVADPKGLSGSGDTVVYVTGTDAAELFENGYAPVNASVVQLVETID